MDFKLILGVVLLLAALIFSVRNADQYNATSLPDGPDRMGYLMGQILRKRITMRGFIIFEDFAPLYPEFAEEMGQWLKAGKIHCREDIVDGLEQAPSAFIEMLVGGDFGKRVIRVGQKQ